MDFTWTVNQHYLRIYNGKNKVAEIASYQFPRLISHLADMLDEKMFTDALNNVGKAK